MSLSISQSTERTSPMRGLLPLWVGAGIYVLLLLAGNNLLNDPDTMWHVTVGQWILDHHAVPETDAYSLTLRGQPWISMYWLPQALYAKLYAMFGWSGPVVLAAAGSAASFALLAKYLGRHLNDTATVAFVAAALALTAPHLLARPHVLALPIMVAWVAGLIDAADRRTAPSFWLLPLIALWANVHGGFVLGLMLVAPIALDAVVSAEAASRKSLALRWSMFGLVTLAAGCCTPYGWNSILAAKRVLTLGSVLPSITEFRPIDFGHIGPFEICLMLGLGLMLLRGLRLPPTRILLLSGLLHMALYQNRATEILALLGPLVIAVPLARQFGGIEVSNARTASSHGLLYAGVAVLLMTGTIAYASIAHFTPDARQSPVAAVATLKKMNLGRVFNDYDFGGYLVANGVAPFIDGRAELYGEKFFGDYKAAIELTEPASLFRMLDDYNIDAILLRTQDGAATLLDHVDGWQKVYSDDIATIHVRKSGAKHSVEPQVDFAP